MTAQNTAQDLIAQLQLKPHPEGGWYRQTYRSAAITQTSRGPRPASTAILFLLQAGEFSALHRIASDELWHFHLGSPLRVSSLLPNGTLEHFTLGPDLAAGEQLQGSVPADRWFGASLVRGDFALVSCTVAPGFDFADFELATRPQLLALYPQSGDRIHALTRA